jgi:hypothetical protein
MLRIAYLDEFGHIGPFVHRAHPNHKTSPVFGLGGIVLPSGQVRRFATWFFQLKNRLLEYEIAQSETHPARWEKKGAALYTTANVLAYRELRSATNRIFNQIQVVGGHVFYVGVEKDRTPEQHNAKVLYRAVLREAIKRLDSFCASCNDQLLIILDEQADELRREIVAASGRSMFGTDSRRTLIEPPIQAESHLYQTLQCADWICGLLGRYATYCYSPMAYQDFVWSEKYFAARLKRVCINSGIRKIEAKVLKKPILVVSGSAFSPDL